MRDPITISLKKEIIEKIHNVKGRNEPRSRFVEDIISEYFDKLGEKISPKYKPSKEPPKEGKC